MPTGIWLDPDTYRQTAADIWGQQVQTHLTAGQAWAQQAMQSAMQQLAPAPPPPAITPPTPPVPVTPVPQPTPAPEPTPVPAMPSPPLQQAPPPAPVPTPQPPTPPLPPPAPPPTPSPPSDELTKAGDSWADQALQQALNPPSPQPQTPAAPTPTPTPATPPSAAPGPPSAIPGPTPTATSASGSIPAGPQSNQPGDYIAQARQAAIAAGIDPDIFTRQIQQESGFQPFNPDGSPKTSPAGAIGIAQFMPGTAQGIGLDPTDPIASLKAAAQTDAQNLAKYGGDWSKALAAYNAGGGKVDKYGGVPPFAETQNYVSTILGGAKDAVQQGVTGAAQAVQGAAQNVASTAQTAAQNVIQTGQTAVNTARDAAQAVVARTSQFAMGLSSGDAMAFCGPAAAMAFAQTYGRNPTVDEAKQLAQQSGWNPSQGMAGAGSEVNLLNKLGVDAHLTNGVDWNTVAQSASSGNPVIIDTPGHYFYVDGYNQQTGQFHLGSSATDLRAAQGQEWFSPDQIPNLGMGAPRAAIYADHPLSASSPTPSGSAAQAQATPTRQSPTYMSTMQPASASAPSPIDQLLGQGQNLLGTLGGAAQNLGASVSDKAQQVQNAVQNVGSQVGGGVQDLLSQATQGIGQAPRTLNDLLTQNALLSQGLPTASPDVTSATQRVLNSALGLPSAIGDWYGQQQAAAKQYGYDLGQPLDLTQPLGPQLGVDPYGQIVQQGVPKFLQGLQTGNVGDVLGGALQTGLGALSAVPGAGGPQVAGGTSLLEDALRSQAVRDFVSNESGTLDLGGLLGSRMGPEDATRMFHGTSAAFDAAAPGRFAEEGLYGPGYYLTSDPRVAGGVIAQGGETVGNLKLADDITPVTRYPGEVISQGYAGVAPKFTSADIAQRQDAVTGLTRILNEEPLAPEGQSYMQQLLSQAKARLAEVAGPNVRAVDVPNSLNLFDADAPVTSGVANAVADQLIQSGPWRNETLDSPEVAERIRDWTTGTGNDLYTELVQETGSKGEANQLLANAGFDGIQHEGGQLVPMTDENGLPIQHQVNVIFPDSLGNLRNAISGTQGGQANVAFARMLGGAAAGGGGTYLGTDPNDPNRWLKVGAGTLAGGLAGGPGLDLAARAAQAIGAGPSGITLGDWLRTIVRGGVTGGIQTASDVAGQATLAPIVQTLASLGGDIARLSPGRLAGRAIGTAQGIGDYGSTFLDQLKPTNILAANPNAIIGRAQPGIEQALAYAAEGLTPTHAAFQQATQNLIQSQELGAIGGELGWNQGMRGAQLDQFVRGFIQNPPANALSAAQGVGARVSGGQQLGTLTGGLGRAVRAIPEPLQSALFPVYQKTMQLGSRGLEYTPIGTLGTAIDVAKAMLGQGPYAAGLGSTPASNAVGPLAERLTNNAIGSALTVLLAHHAVDEGDITGSWQGLSPEQQDVLRGMGQAPQSVRIGGQWYPYNKAPGLLQYPLMGAGAYVDAQHAAAAATAKQQAAGPLAYGIEDPKMAAAEQLALEVGSQLLNRSPAPAVADLYNAATGGAGATASLLGTPVSLASGILGNLIPESANVRTLAQATDPLQRQVLRPQTTEQVLPAILQNLQQNLPGFREQLPARVDIIGRDIQNPLQGLAAVSPLRPAAGQPSPVLEAMAASGVAPTPVPDSITLAPGLDIKLSPDQQRQYEQFRGAVLQRAAGNLPETMDPRGRALALTAIDQAADEAAKAQLLGAISKQGNPVDYAHGTGILAPFTPFGVSSASDVNRQRMLAEQQALMAAIFNRPRTPSYADLARAGQLG